MKTILLVLLLITMSSVMPELLVAEDKVDTPCYIDETNKECVSRLVDIYAKKYRVSAKSMMNTIENENNTFDFDRQSGLKYKKNNRWGFPEGTREKSYGICQIHLPDHPNVSYEEAIDPEFCVEFMAKKFAEGKHKIWMGYEK